jgi:glycosyltransferase involved in cell wall biosynthesis
MSVPAFSVVLKAFNEEDWIADAIRSVLAQTMTDFELIVVDDGSTDGTAAVVEGFQTDPRVRMIRQENRGVAAAINVGIGAARAPYAALIDADDFWMPGYLEAMRAALDSDPNAGFAYTDAWVLDHARARFWKMSSNAYLGEPEVPPADPDAFLAALLEINFVFGLAAIRRTAFEAVGGIDGSLRAAEDYVLWMRLLSKGFSAVRAPGRLAIVRDRQGALHTDEAAMLNNLAAAYRSLIDAGDMSPALVEIATRRVAETEAAAARAGRPKPAIVRRSRRLIGKARRAVLQRDFWFPGTPPEIAAAFPELTRDLEARR